MKPLEPDRTHQKYLARKQHKEESLRAAKLAQEQVRRCTTAFGTQAHFCIIAELGRPGHRRENSPQIKLLAHRPPNTRTELLIFPDVIWSIDAAAALPPPPLPLDRPRH